MVGTGAPGLKAPPRGGLHDAGSSFGAQRGSTTKWESRSTDSSATLCGSTSPSASTNRGAVSGLVSSAFTRPFRQEDFSTAQMRHGVCVKMNILRTNPTIPCLAPTAYLSRKKRDESIRTAVSMRPSSCRAFVMPSKRTRRHRRPLTEKNAPQPGSAERLRVRRGQEGRLRDPHVYPASLLRQTAEKQVAIPVAFGTQ